MKISFTKMHGIGNDYIYVNCLSAPLPDPEGVAVAMSPRHFSVGADGLVLICPSSVADAKMRMFNADGSEGKMCGNAIRCVGKYLYDNNLTQKMTLSIETLSGIKHLQLFLNADGKVDRVQVDMGRADFSPGSVPVLFPEEMIDQPVTVGERQVRLTAVSVGNPHAVCFLPEIDTLCLEDIGPQFERHPLFPERVNTEFVRRVDRTTLEMRVWERGSGETWACGTGACACVAAAVKLGLCPAGEPVTVRLRGGELSVLVDGAFGVQMTGAARTVYEGVYWYEPAAE